MTGRGVDATELIGESEPMLRVRRLIQRVSASDASVLITGETGTGKELVARAIHEASPRRDGPFVAINCAAVPEALLESELFGHQRGAFTDARAARQGLFLKASNGTLLLDEIGEMPIGLQPKLLRALQERRLRAVGSDEEVPFDVRVVAATHRDLGTLAAEGAFRADLYYRLDVVRIDLPPLRERGADVLVLARALLRRAASRAGRPEPALAPAAARALLDYRWPGNVRELANVAERAVALAETDLVSVEDLPERIVSFHPSHVLVHAQTPDELVTLQEMEDRYIPRVLDAVGGNRQRAATVLGLDRKTLYRKLKRLGIG